MVAVFLLCSAATASAQQVTVKLQQVKLTRVLDELTRQTGYVFYHSRPTVDPDRIVSLDVNDVSLGTALEQLFAGTGIGYEINNQKVYLVEKKEPAATAATAGPHTITGIVKDASGMPVIGATVMVKGTTKGTSTSLDGSFTLDVSPTDVLQISYVGYDTQEHTVGTRTSFDITLTEDSLQMEDIVVVGYGVQKKANLTGAVSTVNMDEVLGDRPVISVSEALKGAIPGLQISSNSGAPGEEMSFNIRGTNNLDGNGKPLVLVDNVEMDINMLDPNDIESVTVLKDAASSAIYGARAAFGVILITTKKGSEESRLTVSYSNNFSFSRPANMPHKATPLQTVQLYKDMGTVNYQTGQNVDTWLGLLKEYNANPSAYPDGYAMVDGLRYSLAETDIISDMIETGFQQTHNVSASGGTKDISYRMSFGMVNQDGVLVTDKDSYDRYNVSSYIRSDAIKWITPELDIKYAQSKSSMPVSPDPYGIWGSAIAFPSYAPTGSMVIDDEELLFNTPRNLIKLSSPTTVQKNNLRVFGKVTISPVKNLKLIGEYTFNHSSREKTSFAKKFNYAHVGNFVKESSTPNSKYTYTNGITDYNALNFYGNYANTWNKHEFTAMAGFNQESSDYRYAEMSRQDMINEELPSISQATGDYYAEDNFERYTVRGLFYRLTYAYDGRYLIETNGRYDGSSKFPKNSRFGFFPSVSAAWRISEESFMESLTSTLSNLKLRASWGNIGNQSIDAYAYIPGMDAQQAYWTIDGMKVTTLAPAALVSNNFTWEKVSTIDVGLDLGLFKNRLNVVFDWYQRDTKGMLAPGAELPAVLGASAPLQNTADLRSKGWELTVDWNDKIGEVSYNIGFNLYDSKTTITKYNNTTGLFGKDKDGNQTYRVGMQLGEIWGYVTDRLYTEADFDDSGALLPGIPKVEGYNPNPGDILYKDFDDNNLINGGTSTVSDPGDRKIIGNNTPRYQYGIHGNVSWKGISFSFLLQGVGKRDLWIMNDLFYPHYDAWTTLYDSQLDYWTPEHTNSYFPRIYEKAAGNTGANTLTQTRFLQNGAYLSIRNVTLGYTFPSKWINKLGISRLSVFFSGENLYTFDHLPKGLDPERFVTDDLGKRGFTYPYMRKYSFGINLTF